MLSLKGPALRGLSILLLGLLLPILGCAGGGSAPGGNPVTPPVITTTVGEAIGNEGESLTLSVSVDGTHPFTYQWKRNDSPLQGAASATYTTPLLQSSDDGVVYSVTVSNAAGSRTAAIATIRVKTRPSITTQPAPATVVEGQKASFSVVASGPGTLGYQWRRNGSPIAGATASSYLTPTTILADSGAQFTVVVSNAAGSTTSQPATLTVQPAATTPTFTIQPSGQSLGEGTSVTFNALAIGNGTLTYQWQKDGANLAGKTAASLTLNPVVLADAGSYSVVATNTLNGTTRTATSAAAVLTVNTVANTPGFTTQPSSQTVNEGGNVTFTAVASGNGTITYQWQKNGVDLIGKTGSSLALNPIALADAGSYTVMATNSLNGTTRTATSNAAVLTVNGVANTPSFTTQPASQTVNEGASVTFTAAASGNGTITYHWQKDGVDLAGKIAASLALNPVALADAGSYTVVATNTLNGTTKTATSNAAVLTVNGVANTPNFTTQPSSQTVNEGASVTFTAAASGNGTITYQWQKDGVDLVGKTTASLTLASVTTADAGSYTVVATNTLNGTTKTATSNAAVLTVNGVANTPSFTTQPVSQTANEGASVTFTAAASGNGTITYQWQKDGVDLAGKTTASLTLNPVVLADAGNYTVVATNTLNGTTKTATSNAAVLTVNGVANTPSFTAQPSSQTVNEGASATFTAAASGNGTITYQWQKDGVDLAGKTTASLTLNPVVLADAGSYTVVATNTLNGTTKTATSTAAILTVNAVATTPGFTTQPSSQTVNEGASVTFTAAASGNGTISYQWQKDGVALPGKTGGSLTLTAVTAADAGSYTVVATNSLNGTTKTTTSFAAALIVDAATSLTITTQPQTQTVTAPDSPTFTVAATGSNLSYQWKKNGVALSGATAASYTVPGFTDLQTVADTYTVVVSNGTSSVESTSATFTVVAPNPFYLPGGEPVPVPNRPLTVLPSLHVDAVKFPNGSFRFGYDEALKNPAWTVYADFKVNSTYPTGSGSYVTDTRLAAPQVTPNDMGTHGGAGFYLTNGQGFDRGHMVTRSDVSYRYGSQAGNDATYMSDMIPQVSYFNQRLWNDLEEAVGGRISGSTFTNGLTATFGRVWIYSGPVFTGTTQYWVPSTEVYTANPGSLPVGTLAIAIPTACYRIMVTEPAPGQTMPRVMAWLSSNRSYTTAESADLWKYVTSVERIESLTGLDFFPALNHDVALTALKANVDVRGWGTSFEKTTGPNLHIIEPSWDLIPIVGNPVLTGDSVAVGSSVSFKAAVTPNQSGGTVNTTTGCTWNFGDGTPTATGLTANHVYTSAGSYTVTFSATDSLAQTNTITRIISVVGGTANAAPTLSPNTLANLSASLGVSVTTVAFTVNDDRTAPGSLVVTAVSGNQALLADGGITVVNTNGSVALTLAPTAGQTGSALVTVTITDGDGASTIRTFTLTVASNLPPTFTPDVLPDVATSLNTNKQVTFTLADDATPAGSLTLSVTSNNQAVLTDANILISNASGAVTLALVPTSGATGAALVTVLATDTAGASTTRSFTFTVTPPAGTTMTETFESGTKGGYAVGSVSLTTGSWTLDNALIGTSTSDRKNGTKSVRVTTSGKITMGFDWTSGAQTVTVLHAKYGTDANATWTLWYSANGGAWTQAGSTITTASTTLQAETFTINVAGSIRFEIRKDATTARINVDDFQIAGY